LKTWPEDIGAAGVIGRFGLIGSVSAEFQFSSRRRRLTL
jgi:hypothetical protein